MQSMEQEIFNRVWAGFKAQNWQKSVDQSGSCQYRRGGVVKCAVGHLIPDENYSKELEESVVENREVIEALSSDIRDAVKASSSLVLFLSIMQSAHDHAPDDLLEHAFRRFAVEKNLTIPDDLEKETP